MFCFAEMPRVGKERRNDASLVSSDVLPHTILNTRWLYEVWVSIWGDMGGLVNSPGDSLITSLGGGK